MSTLAGATLAAVLVLSAPPEGPESQRRRLVGKNERAVTVDASNGVVLGMRWRRPVVRLGAHRTVIASFGRPAISTRHNLVILGQGEGEVRALRVEDGTEAWRFTYGVPFETTITLLPAQGGQPEIALATARDGVILALAAASGELVWKGKVGTDGRAPTVATGDLLLVTTVDNKVHALNRADGTIRWSEGRPAPTALTVEGHSAATHHDGVVYAAFSDGYVEAFHLEDGSRIWSRPLSFGGAEFIDADADPLVADGRLYVASYSDGVFAIDLSQGQTIWHQPAPAVTGLALYDDARAPLVVAGSADGFLWGFERETGELLYRTRMPPGAASRVTIREGLLVMTGGDNGLLVFDARSGRPLQATAVAGSLASDPGWAGDYLAAISDAGYIYAFSLGDPGMIR